MTVTEKLHQIRDNESRVYAAGKSAHEREFWEEYQQGGERRDYRTAFAGVGWTDGTFYPLHPIVVEDGWNMFAQSAITELISYYDIIDFSQCAEKGAMACFNGCEQLMYAGVFDLRQCTDIRNFFNNCYLLEIVLVFTFPSGDVNPLTKDAFRNCRALSDIGIAGSIDYSVSFQWSPNLSMHSILSIVEALNPAVTGQTLTLSKTAAEQFSEEEWATMMQDKGDWTVVTV